MILNALTGGSLGSYKDFWALKNINIEVMKGEVLGILGRNGSGKSTLLKILSGVVSPSTGSFELNGKLGTILELSAGFNPNLTGRENIDFYLDVMEVPEGDKPKLVNDVIEFTELEEFIDRPLKTYSSGMKSKLAFGTNTVINPEILFLDEVLSVGDAVFKRKSFSRMEKMIRNENTVIFVSHDLKSVREICNRVVILDRGEIIFSGDTSEGVNLYQQLVHAPNKEKYLEFRNLIKSCFESSNFDPIYKGSDVNLDYISGLSNENLQVQKHLEVDIYKVDIKDESGKSVNILKTQKKYKLTFLVDVGLDLDCIYFRMNIKSNTSIPISFHKSIDESEKLGRVQTSDKISVEWEFDCQFLEGIYFGNIEAYAYIGEKKQTLIRLVDAIAFKVNDLGVNSSKAYGDVVYLNQAVKIAKLN